MKPYLNDQIEIPRLGMGTWQLEGQECVNVVKRGLRLGYRLIDTAQVYDNEEYVGAAIEQSGIARDEIFLVSKIWRDKLTLDEVINSTQKSLSKLKTDYIDLMLIHWPNEDIDLSETMAGMQDLVNEGLAKNFGVSNFPVEWLESAQKMAPEFVTNQVEYHPFIDQAPVYNWLRERGKFLMAYSPLARGQVFKNERISRIANKYGVNEAQVTLSWLLQQEAVVAIPKASSVEHLKSNWESQFLTLESSEVGEISALKKQHQRLIDPEFAPSWDIQQTG